MIVKYGEICCFLLAAYRYRPAGREVNFMKHAHQIKSVAPGSIAEELELEPGAD